MKNLLFATIALFTMNRTAFAATSYPMTLGLDIGCVAINGATHPEDSSTYFFDFTFTGEGRGYFVPTVQLQASGYSLKVQNNQVYLNSSTASVLLGQIKNVPASCIGDNETANVVFVVNPQLSISSDAQHGLVTTTISLDKAAFKFQAALN